MSDEYVLEIKPSARRTSRIAGEWVHQRGRRRTFESKALAREWAGDASAEDRVWVQDAAPTDGRDIDGYLVGGRRAVRLRQRPAQSTIVEE